MSAQNQAVGSTGKIALVTGGSRGLGREIALSLAAAGADLILTYREKKDEGAAVVAEIEALGRKATLVQLDVAQSDHRHRFRDELQALLREHWRRETFDFLVNNAGINRPSKFEATTEDDYDSLMNVHFRGVYFLTHALLPVIADGGRIVNLSTGLARFTTPGYAAYASMKGAIEVLTKYLAKELGPRRINVNIVAPGPIETDFTKNSFSQAGVKDFLASQTALGRVGVPEDIGGVVAFLCSEAGRWLNAQRLEASGGLFL